MPEELTKLLADAKKKKLPVITTVEAFSGEPDMLYGFLDQASYQGVMVYFAPFHTPLNP